MNASIEDAMTTTKDLIEEHNAIAREQGMPELAGWKASKDADQTDADLAEEPSAAEPDEQAPNAAEEAGEVDVEPEVVHTVDLIPYGVNASSSTPARAEAPSAGW
jgi:hypothetical protein